MGSPPRRQASPATAVARPLVLLFATALFCKPLAPGALFTGFSLFANNLFVDLSLYGSGRGSRSRGGGRRLRGGHDRPAEARGVLRRQRGRHRLHI
jgi:hypothetical protein